MLMILARLVRSESFWAVVKVRSPHTGPGIRYIIMHSRTGLAPRMINPKEAPLYKGFWKIFFFFLLVNSSADSSAGSSASRRTR